MTDYTDPTIDPTVTLDVEDAWSIYRALRDAGRLPVDHNAPAFIALEEAVEEACRVRPAGAPPSRLAEVMPWMGWRDSPGLRDKYRRDGLFQFLVNATGSLLAIMRGALQLPPDSN